MVLHHQDKLQLNDNTWLKIWEEWIELEQGWYSWSALRYNALDYEIHSNITVQQTESTKQINLLHCPLRVRNLGSKNDKPQKSRRFWNLSILMNAPNILHRKTNFFILKQLKITTRLSTRINQSYSRYFWLISKRTNGLKKLHIEGKINCGGSREDHRHNG